MNIEISSQQDYYEMLLFRKDALLAEALQYSGEYLRRFGNLMTDLMSLKVECIGRKKAITLAARMINQGLRPDPGQITPELMRSMKLFQKNLDDLSKEVEDARNCIRISSADNRMIKQIYHKMAHQIHPDLHPETWDIEGIPELWEKLHNAYLSKNLDAIQETQFQIERILKKSGQDVVCQPVENLDQKIADLEERIQHIISTEPYTYKEILEDDVQIEIHEFELKDQINEYTIYLNRLDQQLEEMGVEWRQLWPMN